MSAPLVKFKANSLGKNSINRVECARETELSVWIGNSRQAKKSDYTSYHDTWEAAHGHLLKKAESEVSNYRRLLESANGKLGNIKGMKPPKESGSAEVK